jgi:hypothetical protein
MLGKYQSAVMSVASSVESYHNIFRYNHCFIAITILHIIYRPVFYLKLDASEIGLSPSDGTYSVAPNTWS